MSDSGCLVNLLPTSTLCKILTLLHFNEKAGLGHDVVGFLCTCLSEACLQDIASPDLGSSEAVQAHPCHTVGSCLGDGISAGGKGSSLGKGGGGKSTLPALLGLKLLKEGKK